MHERWVNWLTGAATILLSLTLPALAGPVGRQVPTQTIILPSGQEGGGAALAEHAMPSIPSVSDKAGEAPASSSGTAAPGQPPSSPGAGTKVLKPVPTVEYDVSKLPEPVKQLREKLITAAATGEPEQLRPIIEGNGEPPQLSLNDIDDPITYLKSQSGDPEGREILAILIEVLDAGYVHVGVGTPDEMYVWPYFAEYPVDKLTPPQLVELFRLIYAGDYEDMKNEGAYLFYRVGITPQGRWKYFIAGD